MKWNTFDRMREATKYTFAIFRIKILHETLNNMVDQSQPAQRHDRFFFVSLDVKLFFINANVYKTRKWMYIFREKLCSNYSPETILSLHANVAGTFYASSCKTEEKFRLLISFMLFSERYVRCYTDKTVFDIKNILLQIKEELMEKIVKRWKKNV